MSVTKRGIYGAIDTMRDLANDLFAEVHDLKSQIAEMTETIQKLESEKLELERELSEALNE